MRGLGGVGAASALGGVGAASVVPGIVEASSRGLGVGVGVCVGVGGLVEGSWFRMRLRSAKYHALTASSVLWSMSAPPSRKARSLFLFFAATLVRSRSSLTALVRGSGTRSRACRVVTGLLGEGPVPPVGGDGLPSLYFHPPFDV